MNKGLRKTGRVIGAIALGIAAFFGGTWMMTGGARDQANRVLLAVKANDPEALAPLMTPELLKLASPEKVMHMARTWRLQEADQLHWNQWSVGTDGVDLRGHFTHADGSEQSLHMSFVLRDGNWQTNLFQSKIPGLITDPLVLSVPGADEVVRLIGRTTDAVGQSIRQGNVSPLHSTMSVLGQINLSPEDLTKSFAWFLQKRVDISALTQSAPLLDSTPEITPGGLLAIGGHFDAAPWILEFRYRYSNEEGTWRLSSIALGLRADKADRPIPTLH